MEFYNFNEWIFPICELSVKFNNTADIVRFHGSGFFIGNEGYFLSAKHVINTDDLLKETQSNIFSAFISSNVNIDSREMKKIIAIEEHPKYDICIGKINHNPSPFFDSIDQDAYGWEDAHCFGYPEDLNINHEQLYTFSPQHLKGYITRRVSENDLPGINVPPSHVLSFPIPKGVSGSPIFRIGKNKSLLGIALASHDSILANYETSEYEDDKEKFTEKIVQVTQVGVSARIHEFRDWKPSILNGKALKDIY